MTYTVSYTDPIEGVTLADAKSVVDSLDTHNDPANDKVVNHASITWNDDGTYSVQFAIHHRNVKAANVSTEIDAVATVVDSLSVGPSKTEAKERANPNNE